MTDLTGQQIIAAILRGMKEVGERFAAQRDARETTSPEAAALEQAASGPPAQVSDSPPTR